MFSVTTLSQSFLDSCTSLPTGVLIYSLHFQNVLHHSAEPALSIQSWHSSDHGIALELFKVSPWLLGRETQGPCHLTQTYTPATSPLVPTCALLHWTFPEHFCAQVLSHPYSPLPAESLFIKCSVSDVPPPRSLSQSPRPRLNPLPQGLRGLSTTILHWLPHSLLQAAEHRGYNDPCASPCRSLCSVADGANVLPLLL